MGNTQSIRKINFEDVQFVINNSQSHILINTLNESEQECLIPNTVNINNEEGLINKLLQNGKKDIKIIVYREVKVKV